MLLSFSHEFEMKSRTKISAKIPLLVLCTGQCAETPVFLKIFVLKNSLLALGKWGFRSGTIYLDDPAKLGSALYWLRGLVNPLTEAPYSMFPEDMRIIVLMHGTEIVTLARKNEERYAEVVQRMRYYADMGVKFKVCGLALQDFHYNANDLHDFVEVTPSALTELMHWQNQGYALITPQVPDKKFSVEQIR